VTSNNSYSQALFELASENYVLLEVEEQTSALLKLIKKRRFFYVEKIFNDYLDVCSRSRGEIKAELLAAKELNKNDIDKVKNELAENFGSNIKLNYKHDPSLIGGLVIKVGSTMVDTSIKNKLHQIQKQMIEA
jgi:F-type H+-transporting ATPase subunit delta